MWSAAPVAGPASETIGTVYINHSFDIPLVYL